MGGTTSEIIHQGAAYLVQTQDGGPRAQMIETFVYRGGRLVFSRKASWQNLVGDPHFEARLLKMIKDQHQAVCGDLAAGRLDKFLLRS